MANYNYSSLNSKEFEDLSRDLLQRKLDLFLESFKSGKDKGIDLRYSSNGKDHTVLIQAKHFIGSGFSKLFAALKKELDKVKKLGPKRYLVITSVPLSHDNKLNILNLFNDYILNTNDIIGQDDINNLLNDNQDILRIHDKLYLTSVVVISEIINRHIIDRSRFKIKEIQKNIHLYIKNSQYAKATEILNKEHFLIITGEPGVGKTSLADYLSYWHLAEGFEFIYIINDIEDAEKMFDEEKMQLFYFDDFLGANYLKIRHDPNQDATLINFIKRIKDNRNKRLILTTRTTILNQAKSDFERFDSPIVDISRHEIKVSDYSFKDKAYILYNHMFHSELALDYIENIVSNKHYLEIIEHQNYSPRLIEYVTVLIRIANVSAINYFKFIIEKLDHPEDIWRAPYTAQISEAGKFLLQTIFTLPSSVNEILVREAFDERINFEVKNNGFIKQSSLYYNTLKELLGAFIHRRSNESGNFIQFYNPSFADFMSMFLKENHEECERVIRSFIYIEQFTTSFLFDESKHLDSSALFEGFLQLTIFKFRILEKVKVSRDLVKGTIVEKIDLLKPLKFDDSRELALCAFLLSSFAADEFEYILKDLYRNIGLELIDSSQFEDLVTITKMFEYKDTQIYNIAILEWEKIFIELFRRVRHIDDFTRVKNLFDDYGFDYSSFVIKFNAELQAIVDKYWATSGIDEKIDNEDFSDILDKDVMYNKLEQMEEDVRTINEDLLLNTSPAFRKLFSWEYEELVDQNIRDNTEPEYEAPVDKSEMVVNTNDNILEQIDDYFSDLLDLRNNNDV